ncbi:MAG TPA: hypothetical protein VF141_18345 [Chryseolinea sp.]
MKTAMFVLLALFFIVACDDDDNNNSTSEVTKVRNTVVNGQWKITYFFDTDTDETDNFAGYVFEFASNDILTATKGSTNVSGSWSVTDNDSGDDHSNGDYDDIDFNISFASPADFEELTEDWEIISLTSTKIELRHVSGGGGGTDLLTFEKI